MRSRIIALSLGLALTAAAVASALGVSQAQTTPPPAGAAPSIPMPVQSGSPAQIAQGKYIVNNVGMCMDCHGENFHGGPLTFGPLGAMPAGVKFATRASDLVRLSHSRWTPAQMTAFLETGLNPRGGKADPPMPQFRMSHADAEAVSAYLLTLQ